MGFVPFESHFISFLLLTKSNGSHTGSRSLVNLSSMSHLTPGPDILYLLTRRIGTVGRRRLPEGQLAVTSFLQMPPHHIRTFHRTRTRHKPKRTFLWLCVSGTHGESGASSVMESDRGEEGEKSDSHYVHCIFQTLQVLMTL